MTDMAKRKYKKTNEVELDPMMLNGKKIPYPCTNCPKNSKPCSYKYCTEWKEWFTAKWKETTKVLKRKE